ncbi:hypothetical protein AB0B45_44405 [Nonomuraea sp. NPDC049152]
MDVVAGVPKSDPSTGEQVAERGDARSVQKAGGDLRPGGVGEDAIVAGG